MYVSPASPSSPRLIGATVAGIVTSLALYVTSASYLGFGHGSPKPVDFTGSMSSDAAGGPEPKTVMVPDSSIAAPPDSGPPSNVVREGHDRLATVEPAAGSKDNKPGLAFNFRGSGFSKSGPGVVHPALKEAAPAGFPLDSLLAKEAGTTTMSYCVTPQGRVRDVKVTVSSGYKRLDAAAVDWLASREYKPGTIEGAPTEMCGLIDYRWRLDS
jgi:TonB family protein